MPVENKNPVRWTPSKNMGLLELIRAKRQWHWKPSIAEQRKGFRGWHQRGSLPHFDASQVTQFITFQLFDAFPIKSREGIEAILKEGDDSKKRRKLEAWLDRGQGECHLRRRNVAEIVESILLKDHEKMYQLQAWVIMPNHVHLVVDVWEVPLVKLINGWKGAAARAGNKLLGLQGPFWQKDYYDTLIRNEAHLKQAIRYTEQNPVKACLAKAPRDWLWGSAKFRDDYERLICRLI